MEPSDEILDKRFRVLERLPDRPGSDWNVTWRVEDVRAPGKPLLVKRWGALNDWRNRPALAEQAVGAEALKRLDRIEHPHLQSVLRRYWQDSHYVTVSGYAADGTLADALAGEFVRLAPEEAMQWLLPVAEALAAMHAAGVAHLGVWEGNVLRHEGVVKLADGGVVALDVETALTRFEHRGFILAEAARQTLGFPTDVYLWGLLAYRTLQGFPSAVHGIHNLHGAPKRSSRHWCDLPEPWRQALEGSLAWAPEDRWTAAELVHILRHGSESPTPDANRVLAVMPRGVGPATASLAVNHRRQDVAALSYGGVLTEWAWHEHGGFVPHSARVVRVQGRGHVLYDRQESLWVLTPDGDLTQWVFAFGNARVDDRVFVGRDMAFGSEEPWLLTRISPESGWELHGLSRRRHFAELPIPPNETVHSPVFSRDGKVFACALFNGTIQAWDLPSVSERCAVKRLHVAREPIALNADGSLVAGVCFAFTIGVWRTSDGACETTLEGVEGEVEHIAFSPCGRYLACTVKHGCCYVFRLSDGIPVDMFWLGSAVVTLVSFSADGDWLLIGRVGSVLETRRIEDRGASLPLKEATGCVHACALGSDAVVTGGHEVLVWSRAEGRCIRTLDRPDVAVWSLALSRDERLLAMRGLGGSVEVWSMVTGERLQTFGTHATMVFALAFSPDGTLLATSQADHSLTVFRVSDGQPVGSLRHADLLMSVPCFTADGRSIFVGTKVGAVWRWNLDEDKVVQALESVEGRHFTLACDTAGRLLATRDAEGTVRIWDQGAGVCLHTLPSKGSMVAPVAFSDDGRRVACGDAGAVMVFDVAQGRAVCRLTLGADDENLRTLALRFTDAGEGLMVATGDGRFRHMSIPARSVARTWSLSPVGQPKAARLRHRLHLRGGEGLQEVTRATGFTPRPLPDSSRPGIVMSVDGTALAWQAGGDMHVIQLAAPTSEPASTLLPPGASLVALGPRGQAVVYRIEGSLWLHGPDPAHWLPLPAADAAAFAWDGATVLLAGPEGVRVVDAADGSLRGRLEAPPGIVAVAATATADTVVVASGDGWSGVSRDGSGWMPTGDLPIGATADDLAIDPRAGMVAARFGAAIHVWALDGTPRASVGLDGTCEVAMAFGPHGLEVAAWDPVGGEVRAWSLGPGAQGTHREDDACMTALAFQADGRGLVSLSSTGRVQVWDPVDGPSSSGWMLPDAQAWFGPHGHVLAGTTPSSPAITLYDVTGGYPVGRLVPRLSDHEPGPCRALAFTPDEGWLGAVVLADLGNFAVVRFRAGAQAPGTWVEGFNSPASLALAPDGAIAVVGCHAAVGEADVLVGDMTRGERIATLRWHRDHVGAVAYAPDGSGIATADAGGSVAWWVAGSFRRGWEANLPVALTDLAFTRRGAALVARGVDGSLWIWRTADGALLEHILPAWWGAQRTDAGPRGLAVSPTGEGAAVAVAPRGVRFHRLTQGA